MLLLDASDALFLALKERLPRTSIVLVKPGKEIQQIAPNVYLVNPEQEEHFRQLVQSLKHEGLLPGAVLHHDGEVCNLEVKEEVERRLNRGVYALCYRCQAMIRERLQSPLRVLSVFSSDRQVSAPLAAAMSGFLKTLTLENPLYSGKLVEIQNTGGLDEYATIALKVDCIVSELGNAEASEREIRYRITSDNGMQKRGRYVARLAPHALSVPGLSALPLRENGVYLITGGLGGLGLVFSEYLASKFHARLVLIGRSAPNAKHEQILSRLWSFGAETMLVQADVSKLDDMERAVAESKDRFSEIHGVIHCAGVNRDAFIFKKNREEMDAVLAPKVHGAIHLDLATSGEPLDWFILFSSLAGAMGNPGQSDYAYGNRFLDALAEHRESLRNDGKRSGRTLSIAWPFWEEGGMGIAQNQLALLEKETGLSPLPTPEGIRYFEEFLRSDSLQETPIYGIPSRVTTFIAKRTASGDTQAPRAAASFDAPTLFSKTEEFLKNLIGEETKLAPSRIGSSDRLESFGIDSIMIGRINAG